MGRRALSSEFDGDVANVLDGAIHDDDDEADLADVLYIAWMAEFAAEKENRPYIV
jgi:hypothetical protein